MPRWYFDTSINDCAAFYYGGCGGNGNNFLNRENCRATCVHGGLNRDINIDFNNIDSIDNIAVDNIDQIDSVDNIDNIDNFDHIDNIDNFDHIDNDEETEQFMEYSEDEESSPPVCSLPKESGPCRALHRMWFWDSSSGQCKRFVYGGCRGNRNRFGSFEDCLKTCAKTGGFSQDYGIMIPPRGHQSPGMWDPRPRSSPGH